MTYSYRNDALIDLPMRMAQHDPVNSRTLDMSGNGYHATFGNGSTAATFPTKQTYRRGYSFDGGDYFVNASIIPTLNLNADFTVSLMLRILGSGTYGIYSMRDTANDGVYFFYDGANSRVRSYYNSTVANYTIPSPDPSGVFSIVYDVSGSMSIYFDGVLGGIANISAETIALTSTSLFIGCLATADAPGTQLMGSMYQYMIHPYILSPIQISDLHKQMMKKVNDV